MFDKLSKSQKNFLGLVKQDWMCIFGGLAIYIGVALWNISKASIWFDEAFGAYLIRFDFLQIARYTAADVHPPLYYWLLKIWSMIFGNNELALRSMSIFFGAIAIILSYALVKKLFNKKAARVSLAFLIISPMIIRYSQEARMYMLVACIALAATYMLVRATETKKRRDYLIYGLLVSLGMWTHYFSAIVWLAHWVWRADNVRRSAKKGRFVTEFFSKDWLAAHFLAVGLYVAWMPFFVYQLCNVQYNGFWIPAVSANTIPNFFTNVFYYLDSNEATSWLALLFLAITTALIVLAAFVYKKMNKPRQQSYRLIMSLTFVPIILLFLSSMPPLRSSFVDRYLITSVFGFMIFAGVTLTYGLKKFEFKYQIMIFAAIFGIMIFGVYNVYRLGNFNKTTGVSNQTRQIIEKIREKSPKGQAIIARSPWTFYEAIPYATNDSKVYFLDETTDYRYGSLDMLHYNDQFKIKSIQDFAKNHSIIWYVGRPAGEEMTAPCLNWKKIQEITLNDAITGQPAYKAVQYQINQ